MRNAYSVLGKINLILAIRTSQYAIPITDTLINYYTMTKPIHPCLWFEKEAKAAADFYCSVFPNSKITSENPMVVMFQLNGSTFMALNDKRGNHPFTEAVSFVVTCDTQDEIDHYWNSFTLNGGKESLCGWCTDKFGVSWQVVPSILGELMSDPSKAPRVIQAFLKMKKFDIEKLKNA
jgi:predicted 3-demethylubiquinone-9 3-methyltransferase (glyoxalase superfamily)